LRAQVPQLRQRDRDVAHQPRRRGAHHVRVAQHELHQPRLQIDGDLGIGALEVVRGDDPIPSGRDGWWDDRADLGVACP